VDKELSVKEVRTIASRDPDLLIEDILSAVRKIERSTSGMEVLSRRAPDAGTWGVLRVLP
jgi:hypothetical protein